MWMVNPGVMCNQHLLGEHVELHMLAGTIKRNKSIKGYLNGLVQPSLIIFRHAQLVEEMARRNMKHKSAIDSVDLGDFSAREISEQDNLVELERRCRQCAARIAAGQRFVPGN
jgi:hypothetical protein